MPFALTCKLRPDAMPTLMALRGAHLDYIRARLSDILFGGPARGPDGTPQEMIIVLRTEDRDQADAFIHAEPYTASGKVFATIEVRPWSQVVPEAAPGALDAAISAERANANG
jgi:uncharacterized protein YciI